MLLLSNLSLQILDSENKQMDQSSRLLQPNALLQTPQRHAAAVLPRGWGQKYTDGWIKNIWAVGGIQGQETKLLTLLPVLSDPLLWTLHPWSSRLSVLSLTPFSRPCSLLLRRIGVYSRQSTPVQEVERRRTQGNAGSWMDFRGGKSYHNSNGTLTRFKWRGLRFIKPRSLAQC